MTGMIFFGGLVLGFLIGWIGLALLTMSSLNNRDQELEAGSLGKDSQ
ncbi:MAG: hypothetical protein M1438_12140 [Deltaproteobacteria bacterium]|nr:hypothetical protein [Deltaproteobacteria bacterium]